MVHDQIIYWKKTGWKSYDDFEYSSIDSGFFHVQLRNLFIKGETG